MQQFSGKVPLPFQKKQQIYRLRCSDISLAVIIIEGGGIRQKRDFVKISSMVLNLN